MTRTRVATVLGVVALLSVLGTTAVALTREEPVDPIDPIDPAMLSVTRDGSAFEVPADDWTVEDGSVRIFYTDERDRPVAVVRGPAVYRAGYCGEGSNQAFAGFTRQPIEAWAGALGDAGPVDREQVQLADGTAAISTRVVVEVDAEGPCAATEAEVSMIEADGVRVVLVQDAGTVDEDLLLSLSLDTL